METEALYKSAKQIAVAEAEADAKAMQPFLDHLKKKAGRKKAGRKKDGA